MTRSSRRHESVAGGASLELLLDALAAIASERDEAAVLGQTVDLARLVTRAPFGTAFLVDGRRAHHAVIRGAGEAAPPPATTSTLVHAVLRAGMPVRLATDEGDTSAVTRLFGGSPVGSFLGVPLRHEGEVLGALCLARPPGRGSFTHEEASLAEAVARHAAVALRAGRALSERERAVEGLAAAYQLKTDFVAMASHELRTPLTPILGYSMTLLDHWEELDDARKRHFVEVVKTQSLRLSRIIKNLLTAIGVDAGTVAPTPRHIDVRDVVLRAVREQADRAVTVKAPGGVVAVADADHVLQIVANLVSNATRFGEPPVEVDVRDAGDEIQVVVSDAGPGIAEEEVPALFRRTPGATTSDGFGIGLAVASDLARMQGGRLWYEPNRPVGARFVLALPKSPEGVRPDPALLSPRVTERRSHSARISAY